MSIKHIREIPTGCYDVALTSDDANRPHSQF